MNLFIDDLNLNKMLEMKPSMDTGHPFWRLLWRMLDTRNLRWDYFV